MIFQIDFTWRAKKRGWFRCCKIMNCELNNIVWKGHSLYWFDTPGKLGTHMWGSSQYAGIYAIHSAIGYSARGYTPALLLKCS